MGMKNISIGKVKDSFMNLDQNLLKVVKKFGLIECIVQVTQDKDKLEGYGRITR